jgi:ligand-binding sensor domain-containing protein
MKLFLILLPVFLFTGPFQSQNLNYIHYNTNNSKLPHDIVYRLNQDKAGMLWIATDDGLVRFDGTEMEAIDKGFSSKYIICTNEENGRLWAGTWKGGIYVIKGDSACLVTAVGDDGFCYSTNNITVFNDLVIVHKFEAYMVLRYDTLRNTLAPVCLKENPDKTYTIFPPQAEYYNFAKTARHHLYAYNNRGIFEVQRERLIPVNRNIKADFVWESSAGQLYYMNGQVIYACNDDFTISKVVYVIDPGKFGNKAPVNFKVLPSGNLCLGFKNLDLHNGNPVYYLINTVTGDIIDFSKDVVGEVLSADVIVDREGGVWLSTDGRGLYHIFDYKFKLLGGDKVFENSTITALRRIGRDSLFIGTKEGLYLYYNNQTVLLKDPGLSKNYPVKKLFSNADGQLGVIHSGMPEYVSRLLINGRFTGCSYYEAGRHSRYSYAINIGALNITDHAGLKARRYKLSLSNILFVEENHDGLCISTYDRGLWHFNPDKGLTKYSVGIPENILVNCATFVEGKGMWFGTNKGLYLVDMDRKVHHWGLNEGLTNLNILCLFAESVSSLWIGTQNGLFNLRNNTFSVYKRRDGLIADDVSCLERLNDKELAVGSSKGITLLLMRPPAGAPVPVVDIHELKINNLRADWRRPVEVPYDNNISLSYGAITFIYPELLTFYYRLHEHEPWISTQNKSLVFTDLQPGDYGLELKVKKYNTGFSAPVIVNFTILLPWWRTSWFFTALFMACIGIVYLVLRRQLHKQQQEALVTLEFAELKMKALHAQLNPHFISNALNTIQLFILKRDELSANNYLGQFSDLTRSFLEVSRNRFVNLETELNLLGNYLSLEKLRFENKFDYIIDLDPSIHLQTTYIPALLVQPFVENSINHGIVYLGKERTGLITISISKVQDFIGITINDNGIGRKKAKELKKRLARSYPSYSSQIIDELKQAYNLIPGCYVNIETLDKENEEQVATGTCVNIKVRISNSLN